MKTRTVQDAGDAESPAFWREQEMLLLQQVMALVGKNLSPVPVFREMLHLMSELLGLNRGRIVLRDERQRTGRIRHAYGLTAQEVERGCYMLGEGVTGSVLQHGQLAIVQDIDAEPTFLARAVERSNLPSGPVSFIALPIVVERVTIGVLACHRIRRRTRALADDVTLLRILATLVGQLLQLEASLQQKTRALEQQNAALARALESASARYGIIGTSPRLLRAISELERVSDSSASVLLLGESGTGKELFARALHLASPRHDKAFIKINCAAIPDTLFESELFGYERGAFTGAATMRAGWFEQADTGTIFLDEIGELPLTMQTKLLRTLQEGTITRLGGKQEIRVDVRLVAATNRNLQADVARGTFRQDLFYRLNVIPIHLPSLSERHEDIRELALHFINHANQANQRNVNLTATALERLQQYSWPGNIRELANLIERIVLLADHPFLDAADIERFLPQPDDEASAVPAMATRPLADPASALSPEPGPGAVPPMRPYGRFSSHPAEALTQALRQCGGNKSRAAQKLGMTVRQFSYRWSKLGLTDV
ncbi:sigma 54-interacting transcriptional regulator [Paraburkholderia sp. BL9I2N2]|uniref:sigma 54-interacting transcriptional regulator n=1 Tax=Paraburkholderia sp. BL9I2N2 TaxID=1938809 RepID=UPI0010F1F817|nr:sigma 54-interacting transcriptional regulator [Paraburkholderia sp. BL9I2N2]TCK84351.1 Fis family NifA subfamily transcriptional regulator [Paraburkholderia sp. BL9I2N2]